MLLPDPRYEGEQRLCIFQNDLLLVQISRGFGADLSIHSQEVWNQGPGFVFRSLTILLARVVGSTIVVAI